MDMGRLKVVRFLTGETRVVDLAVGSETDGALRYVNAAILVYAKNARFIRMPKSSMAGICERSNILPANVRVCINRAGLPSRASIGVLAQSLSARACESERASWHVLERCEG